MKTCTFKIAGKCDNETEFSPSRLLRFCPVGIIPPLLFTPLHLDSHQKDKRVKPGNRRTQVILYMIVDLHRKVAENRTLLLNRGSLSQNTTILFGYLYLG